MNNDFEELVQELKTKYPKARMPLNDILYYIGWIKDRVSSCHYAGMMYDFEKLGESISWAIREGNIEPSDVMAIVVADEEFRIKIGEKLKRNCELR